MYSWASLPTDLLRQLGKSWLSDDLNDLHEKSWNKDTGEVTVTTRISPEQLVKKYRKLTPRDQWAAFEKFVAANQGKYIVFVGATFAGGGVAIMRMVLIALLRAMGVDAHWVVMRPFAPAFEVTKHCFHDTFQDVDGQVELTAEAIAVYEWWTDDNAVFLRWILELADVVFIDDWQPSRLILHLLGDEALGIVGINPNVLVAFRNHIATEGKLMSTPGTSQYKSWCYVWYAIGRVRLMIFHPRPDRFVPDIVPSSMVALMGATSDLIDGLNQRMKRRQKRAGVRFINGILAATRDQKPINQKRPIQLLVARFDPSKGMDLGLAAYVLERAELIRRGVPLRKIPKIVIVGNGSIDDPAGPVMLEQILNQRETYPLDVQDDIKVARVPHNDLAINALMWMAIFAMQPSTKEGFENRVTDAIFHWLRVIGSTAGGIPLQIRPGTGFVIDPHLIQEWADVMVDIVTESWWRRYQAKRRVKQVAKAHNMQFTTIPNAISLLYVSYMMASDPDFQPNGGSVFQMAMAEYLRHA